MNKLLIMGAVVSIVLGIWASHASLAAENGELAQSNKQLKQEVAAAESEKTVADERIRHLSELYADMMLSKAEADQAAADWRDDFNEEKSHDEECETWSDARLPACVLDRLRNNEPTSGENGDANGTGTGGVHETYASPGHIEGDDQSGSG